MPIPHIFIKKGAVLKGVNLVGLNVVFEVDQLPTGEDNDDAMLQAFKETTSHTEDIFVANCMRSSTEMYAQAHAQLAISKAILDAKTQKGRP